jgi:hypothetical protein
MRPMTADEVYDRLLCSLKENSAELSRERRREHLRQYQTVLAGCLVFGIGAVVGGFFATSELGHRLVAYVSKLLGL